MMDEWIFRYVLSFLLYSATLFPSQTFGIGDTHLCSSPLGMESGLIPNSALSASSYYVKNVGPDTARLNRDSQGGAWCPKEPISIGVREWLQVSLNGTHLLSGVQLQGRYSNGLGQEYTEEFQLEYWREGFATWRKYYRNDGKSVFPGNTDTSSVVTTRLRPPLLAEKVRFVPYSAHRRVVCLRVELLGCPMQGGIVQYEIPQGDQFSEGISLRDETYDGSGSKWDRSVESAQNFHQQVANDQGMISFPEDGDPFPGENEESLDNDNSIDIMQAFTTTEPPFTKPREILTNGLGQLTDCIEGANSFTMDIGYGLGNGWVGWRKRPEEKEWIELIFEFDAVRQFSHVDIFSNNYPSKGVQYFSRCVVHFSNGGVHWNGQSVITYTPLNMGVDLSREQTRNISVPLEHRIGKYLKLQLHFKSQWILLGELYFHSTVFDGNWTLEEDGLLSADMSGFPVDAEAPLEIGDLSGSMVETVVGILTGLILLSGVVAGVVICLRKNGKTIPSLRFRLNGGTGDRSSGTTFHFPWRHSWNSVPTHIVAQTNTQGDGVKDILLTLTPQMTAANGGGGIGGREAREVGRVDVQQHLYVEGPNNQSGLMLNGGAQLAKVHNNLRGIQSSEPPPYEQATTREGGMVGVERTHTLGKNNHVNAVKIQGSHGNNYGKGLDSASSTSGCYSNNASSASSNLNPALSCSPTKMTLRSNQLANEDEWLEQENSEMGPIPINSTMRTSTNRHRRPKVASSTWNLSYEGTGRPPRNQRGHSISDISLRQLRLIENLGSCVHGQVHLYDFEGEIECQEGIVYSNCRLIAKTIKSMGEIRLLGVLDHEHVLEMICLCTELKKPILALYPAPECGDLCSFLSRLTNTPSLSWLLTVAVQIASGMNYLESLNLVHKDLAARNCLVEREGSIRISDLAMACEQYRDDYCITPQGLKPLRWWSWESILSGEFTLQSSVWSFGVTLWEILTLCRQKPLHHIADHQLVPLAEKYGQGVDIPPQQVPGLPQAQNQVWLPKPLLSPPEIFDLIRECWKREAGERPTFQNIYLFLEQKCANSAPIYQTIT